MATEMAEEHTKSSVNSMKASPRDRAPDGGWQVFEPYAHEWLRKDGVFKIDELPITRASSRRTKRRYSTRPDATIFRKPEDLKDLFQEQPGSYNTDHSLLTLLDMAIKTASVVLFVPEVFAKVYSIAHNIPTQANPKYRGKKKQRVPFRR